MSEAVYVGIGSNLGDRHANCEEAVRRIGALSDVRVISVSVFYETVPVGGPPQPMYINGVVCIETGKSPSELLIEFKAIEKNMGRPQTCLKDHPRVIDLDILLYGLEVIDNPELKVPHPRMHERFFVLKGLVEIAPLAIHPVFKETARDLLKKVQSPSIRTRTEKGS